MRRTTAPTDDDTTAADAARAAIAPYVGTVLDLGALVIAAPVCGVRTWAWSNALRARLLTAITAIPDPAVRDAMTNLVDRQHWTTDRLNRERVRYGPALASPPLLTRGDAIVAGERGVWER